MPTRDRSKRRYGFSDISAPTKREVLEIIEREGPVSSAGMARLMGIPLNHASRLMRGYWAEGLLHRELDTKRRRGTKYLFSLTKTGRAKLAYFRGK